MAVLKVTKDVFESQIKTSDKVVMLDFYADWCGPCNMVAPLVAELAEENPDYCIGKVNVDDDPELAGQYKVMSIPNFVLIKNGRVVDQVIGAVPKAQMLSKIQAAL